MTSTTDRQQVAQERIESYSAPTYPYWQGEGGAVRFLTELAADELNGQGEGWERFEPTDEEYENWANNFPFSVMARLQRGEGN